MGTDGGGPGAAALEDVYRSHAGAVYQLARRLVGNAAAADVTQDVFVKVWRHSDRFDPTRGTYRSLLLRMTHDTSVEHLRSASRRDAREQRFASARDRAVSTDEEAFENPGQLVHAALLALNPKERSVIETTYFGACSYREAALVLGLPEGTVKSRIRTSLAKMHRELLACPSIAGTG